MTSPLALLSIGAYTVNVSGRKITFLDTPGHEVLLHAVDVRRGFVDLVDRHDDLDAS